MKFVKITVDNVVYNLMQLEDGTWVVTNRNPLSDEEYVMTITVVTEAGQEITIDTTDEELLKAVTLLVKNGSTESGRRMLDYYPWIIKIILEFQAIIFSEGFEIDFLKSEVRMAVNDAWLLTMGELRIAEWENLLHLTPDSDETIEDRRDKIIATLRGKGKLNTELINSIVGAYTNGGTAESYIRDSVLYVNVNPPKGNKSYKFANIENTLKPLVPAHIGLSVSRNYATWGDIKNNFVSWDDVKNNFNTWEDVYLFIPSDSNSPDSRLPYGYTELEYIEGSGTQYIDTGVKATAKTTAKYKYLFDEIYKYGPHILTGSAWYFPMLRDGTSGGAFVVSRGANQVSSNAIVPKTGFVYEVDAHFIDDKVTVNGVEYGDYSMGSVAVDTVNLHIMTPGVSPGADGFTLKGKLYYCQIFEDGELIRDYVPCKKASGEVGMYDLVNAEFYGNAGSGSFIPSSN